MTIAEFAQIASATATMALAILTFLYVRATRAMVDEMRAARDAGSRPYVVAYAEYVGYAMYVTAENAGSAPAEDVVVRVDGTRPAKEQMKGSAVLEPWHLISNHPETELDRIVRAVEKLAR